MKRWMFSTCYLLQYLAIGLFIPYLAVYFQGKGITGLRLGWLLGVMPLIRIIAQPLWSFFGDLFQSHKTLLVVASIASALSAAALLFTTEYIWLFAMVILYALLSAAIDPYLISMTLSYLKHESREEDFGLIRLWGSFGFAVSTLMVGAFLLDDWLYLLPLIYAAVLACFAVAVVFLPVQAGSLKSPHWIEGIRILPDRPILIRFFIGCLFVGATIGTAMQYQVVFMNVLGASGWIVGVALSLQAIIEIPLMAAAPRLMHRFGVEKTLLFGVLALPVRWLLFSIIKNPIWILPVQSLHSISIVGLMVVGMVFVSRQVPDQWKATGLGMYSNVLNGIGPAVGLSAAGWIDQELGIRMIWIVSLWVVLVGIVILFPVLRSGKEKELTCLNS